MPVEICDLDGQKVPKHYELMSQDRSSKLFSPKARNQVNIIFSQ